MIGWIIAIVIIIVAIIVRSRWEIRNYKVIHNKIYSTKALYDMKIVVIADLHNCVYDDTIVRVMRDLDTIKPDFVIVAGDMIVGKRRESTDKTVEFLNKIAKEYTIYYANGNHETRIRDAEYIYGRMYKNYIKSLDLDKIVMIENQHREIGNNTTLYGLEIEEEYYKKRSRTAMSEEEVTRLIGESNPNKFNLVIAHNPKFFEAYSKWGADLVISGHNHGGIIGIPFTTRGVVSTDFKILDHYSRGEIVKEDSTMIVSSGMGSHTINFRLFNRPQLNCITISKKPNDE